MVLEMIELHECLLDSSNQPVLLPQQELEIFQRLLDISVILVITFSEKIYLLIWRVWVSTKTKTQEQLNSQICNSYRYEIL